MKKNEEQDNYAKLILLRMFCKILCFIDFKIKYYNTLSGEITLRKVMLEE